MDATRSLVATALVFAMAARAPPAAAYEPYHLPIFIDGDSDLCAPGSGITNCATADGSADRPYRIEAWSLSTTGSATGIRIQFVSKHVVILNNDLRGTAGVDGVASLGVMVWASDHVVVQSNAFRGMDWGVFGADGEGLAVSRNTFDVGDVGVLFDGTRSVSIDHNLFRGGSSGVSARGPDARIALNQFEDEAWALDVQAQGTGLVASRNNFLRSAQFALESFTESYTDARCNWWDSARGPSLGPDFHPPGGRVYGHVTTSPYLTEADRYTGPAGHDPTLAPIDPSHGGDHALDETLYWFSSPCYDAVPGGPY